MENYLEKFQNELAIYNSEYLEGMLEGAKEELENVFRINEDNTYICRVGLNAGESAILVGGEIRLIENELKRRQEVP